MSADILGNRTLTRFDVLIIGSGTGGSSAAAILTANGQNVLVLEAGPNHYQGLDDPMPANVTTTFSNDELKMRRRYFIDQDPLIEPRTFRSNDSMMDREITGDINALPKCVGGAAVHSDIKTPRFLPFDFELGTMLSSVTDANFADWPITYDQLEPFYTWAETTMGVSGVDGADPNQPRRSRPYVMGPGVPMYAALRLADGARMRGLSAFPYPMAINSRPYDNRPACNDCGFCGGYGCPTHAKGAPAVTLLRRALLSGRCQLRPETRVVRLTRSGSGMSISGVEAILPDGARMTFTADRYVLAASPIEDARLCLISDPGGPGIGNSSGMLGRNLMFHFQTLGIGIVEERMHVVRSKNVTHAITEYRGVPNDPMRPLGGIIELGGPSHPIEESFNYGISLGAAGPRLKALLRQSPMRDHLIVLTMQAEDAPQARNRVDLDPGVRDYEGLPVPRISYSNHRFELGARDFYSPKLLDILQSAGARWAFIAPVDRPAQSRHILGTLRFGTDARQSVCNGSGRFHDVDNLYCADGALFPTSSGYNPILTIVSVCARVAGDMVFPGSPERALM